MDLIKEIDCFLLDLDGTVYLGSKLLPGATDAIDRMRTRGKRVIFLTNNSSATKDYYVSKLRSMGIDAKQADVYTSANATTDYLTRFKPNAKVYVLGSQPVKDEFISGGVTLSDDADTVVITFDKTLDYARLCRACYLIEKGAFYIATHPDMTCPVEDTQLPDVGSFIKLIEGTTGRLPDVICGKPYKIMADGVSKFTGVPLSRTAMVGDRLTTDMKFAVDNGLRSVLTLTGEATLGDYSRCGFKVDKIINSIAEWDV